MLTYLVSIEYDARRRLQKLSDATATYLQGSGYNAAGQATGATLGISGVIEAFGYDANRLQMTTLTATAPGGSTERLPSLPTIPRRPRDRLESAQRPEMRGSGSELQAAIRAVDKHDNDPFG